MGLFLLYIQDCWKHRYGLQWTYIGIYYMCFFQYNVYKHRFFIFIFIFLFIFLFLYMQDCWKHRYGLQWTYIKIYYVWRITRLIHETRIFILFLILGPYYDSTNMPQSLPFLFFFGIFYEQVSILFHHTGDSTIPLYRKEDK